MAVNNLHAGLDIVFYPRATKFGKAARKLTPVPTVSLSTSSLDFYGESSRVTTIDDKMPACHYAPRISNPSSI